jgi:hypothetical protein
MENSYAGMENPTAYAGEAYHTPHLPTYPHTHTYPHTPHTPPTIHHLHTPPGMEAYEGSISTHTKEAHMENPNEVLIFQCVDGPIAITRGEFYALADDQYGNVLLCLATDNVLPDQTLPLISLDFLSRYVCMYVCM